MVVIKLFDGKVSGKVIYIVFFGVCLWGDELYVKRGF